MQGPHFHAAVNAASAIVAVGANLLLASTFLIALGLLAARLASRAGAALQSAIFRATLVCLLAAPCISWAMYRLGFQGPIITLPDPRIQTQSATSTSGPADVARSDTRAFANGSAAEVQPSPSAEPLGEASLATDESLARHDTELARSPSPQPVRGITPEPAFRRSVALAYISLAAAWILASGLLLLRLAVSHVLLEIARRTSLPSTPAVSAACQQIALLIGVRPPQVVTSSRLKSPCLFGCRRATILLPSSLPAPGREILLHELAHLARRDSCWNLLSRLSAAVLFFQPLTWLLARRLEDAADQVCDDIVLEHGVARAVYARELRP